jgi:hypothetical protein
MLNRQQVNLVNYMVVCKKKRGTSLIIAVQDIHKWAY